MKTNEQAPPRTLDEAYSRALSQVLSPARITAGAIVVRLRRSGVRLSRGQVEEIRSFVERSDLNRIDWTKLPLPSRSVRTIRVGKRDLKTYLAHLERGLARSTEAIIDRMSKSLVSSLKRNSSLPLEEERINAGFEERLRRTWRKPFRLLGMINGLAREVGAQLLERVRQAPDPKNRNMAKVLVELHVRACQVAAEVRALLRSGFADGAMARWRTLHEIVVVGVFILERGEEVAERYLAHESVEAHKAAKQYQKHYRRLRYDRISRKELRALARGYAEALRRYGKEFGNSNGWAAAALRVPRPNFDQIESAANLAHWRPFYRMASHNVHANVKGLTFRLGIMNWRRGPTAGASNYGLADPGQNTAISLAQITGAMATLAPSLDALVGLKAMDHLAREAGAAFVEVQRHIERRERALWRRRQMSLPAT